MFWPPQVAIQSIAIHFVPWFEEPNLGLQKLLIPDLRNRVDQHQQISSHDKEKVYEY